MDKNTNQDRNQAPAGEGTLIISERASARIKSLLDQNQKSAEEFGFRVAVHPGGCSGFEYDMDLSQKRFGDLVFTRDGIRVFVDGQTLKLIQGSTLDYLESVKSSSFQILNPNASGSCGCGVSFSL